MMVTVRWPSGPAASVSAALQPWSSSASVAWPASVGSPCPVCAVLWPGLASVVRQP